MGKTITLASGQITAADTLTVELHRPADLPAFVLIKWPAAPSVTDTRKFGPVTNAVIALLAEARARLATIKAAEM